ncbi:unnamed protein product, partial [Cyprideis torosa]
SLISSAQERLNRLNISNATFKKLDGRKGTQGQGLYDGIITDLAFDERPRFLLDQLVSGGVVIAAIGPKLASALVLVAISAAACSNDASRLDEFITASTKVDKTASASQKAIAPVATKAAPISTVSAQPLAPAVQRTDLPK